MKFIYSICLFIGIEGIHAPYSIAKDSSIITEKFIGFNKVNTIGIIKIQYLPLNQIYTMIDLKNMNCGAHIQGYTEQQNHRFIVSTAIGDPMQPDNQQCKVTFIHHGNHISITNVSYCHTWPQATGCSFHSIEFDKVPS